MAGGFVKGITADVKLTDEQYVNNEKARYVPFPVSPFQELESQGSEETDRPPEWLELARDLAWTASFSSVTSNTTVTGPMAVWNYAVFFALTWHLWATQTTYDIKYYTNDWWHRALFASQLAIYVVLAALSGSFNVGWEPNGDTMNPFTGNNTALTGKAIRENEVLSMKTSLSGIIMVLFISRMFLLLQYLRVIWYRRQSKQLWSWRLYLPPVSIFTAGCIFLGCFIMLRENDGRKSVAVTQLTLWGLAISIQALAAAFTPEDEAEVLKRKSTLTPRLSALTVIILGFRIKAPSNRAIEELWLWSHFPLHLSLILLLEGIKNIFIAANALGAIELLQTAFYEVISFIGDTGELPKHPQLEALLLPLKTSWKQEVIDLTRAVKKDTDDSYTEAFAICQTDPEAEFKFNEFIASNNTALANDYNDEDSPLLAGFYTIYFEQMAYTGHWIVAVSGTLIMCMAILNTVQRRPRNRFAWGYTLSRVFIGVTLIIVGGVTSKWIGKEAWIIWVLPTVVMGYGLGVIIDWILLFFSVRSIRNKEGLSRAGFVYSSVEKGDYDYGTGVNLAHLSHLPYGHGPPHRAETAPVGMYAQGPMGSSASLYAASGEDEKLHQGSQYHLPYKP